MMNLEVAQSRFPPFLSLGVDTDRFSSISELTDIEVLLVGGGSDGVSVGYVDWSWSDFFQDTTVGAAGGAASGAVVGIIAGPPGVAASAGIGAVGGAVGGAVVYTGNYLWDNVEIFIDHIPAMVNDVMYRYWQNQPWPSEPPTPHGTVEVGPIGQMTDGVFIPFTYDIGPIGMPDFGSGGFQFDFSNYFQFTPSGSVTVGPITPSTIPGADDESP